MGSPPTFLPFLQMLRTALRLLRVRMDDLRGLDISGAGARRSFLLMLLALPIYGITVFTLAKEDLEGVPLAKTLLLLATDFSLQWTLFPFSVYTLLRITRHPLAPFPAFVVVNNWLSMLGAFAALPLLLIYHSNVLNDAVIYTLMDAIFFAFSFSISLWATRLFQAGFAFGAVVFITSILLSQGISLTTVGLLKSHTLAAL